MTTLIEGPIVGGAVSEPAARDEPVSIELETVDSISYAFAHNRVPVVRQVFVTNSTGRPIESVRLDIEVVTADGVLNRPFISEIGLLETGLTPISTTSLQLDPTRLAGVEEQRPGIVRARLTLPDGSVLAEVDQQARVLAHNQWIAITDNLQLSLEAIAAHVMPNHPSIERLLTKAHENIGRRTGSTSLEGYQSDTPDLGAAQRSDAIAEAIYDAMVDAGINYINPPASWDAEGQKIRTPDQVLDGRQGTCLDTAVVMAAAFEQAGLGAGVVIVQGHAFAAYLRGADGALFARKLDAVISDWNDFAALVDNGALRLVETTTVTPGPNGAPFQAATQRNSRFLGPRSAEFEGVVNIGGSRIRGVVPLPARVRGDDGSTTVIEYRPIEHGVAAPATPTRAGQGRRVDDDAPQRVQQWKSALLDLSERNALISYQPRRHGIDVIAAKGTLGLIEDSLHLGHPLILNRHDALTEMQQLAGSRTAADLTGDDLRAALVEARNVFVALDEAGYRSRLRTLASNARREQEESGANNLYLTLGSLVYSSTKTTRGDLDLRAPLILVSVKLVGGGRRPYQIVLDEAGTSTCNVALLEKLRNDHDLRIPDMEQPPLDGAGIDVERILQSVRQACLESGLNFRVEDAASLALLKFGTFRLWKDLQDHWRTFMTNPLVKHLVESPAEPFEDTVPRTAADLDAVAARCPIPADGSQLRAIARAASGETFVLEGPPGTGKSQTITNLLANAMAEGKKVLFVAEKQAALDVVKRRLAAAGLGSFCLDMHNEKSKPATIRQQLQDSLYFEVEPDVHGMQAAQARLNGAVGELQRYPGRLHDKNAVGLSLWDARQRQLALGDGPALPVPRHVVDLWDAERVEKMSEMLAGLSPLADAANVGPRHPWRLSDAKDFVALDRTRLAAAIATLADYLSDGGTEPVRALLDGCRQPSEIDQLLPLLRDDLPDLTELDAAATPAWHARATAAAADVASLPSALAPVLADFQLAVLGAPLERWLDDATQAKQSMVFGRKKRLTAVVESMTAVIRPGAQVDPDDLPTIIGRAIALRDHLRRAFASITAVPGFGAVPDLLSPDAATVVADRLTLLADSGRRLSAGDDLVTSVRACSSGGQRARTRRILQAWADVLNAVGSRRADVDAWLDGRTIADALVGSIGAWRSDAVENRFKRLQHWIEWCAAVAAVGAAGLEDAAERLADGVVSPADAVGAFNRGLATAAVRERRDSTGLDRFHGEGHDVRIGSYVESADRVRSLLRESIPSGLLGKRPFKADALRGDAALLSRELDKRSRPMSVRGLLKRFPGVIAELTPCFLMSPDSVARFLEPGAVTFDLVVFDEASQIRVPEAIGAMGRARAVVVVGDEKQMPPTSVAQVSTTTGPEVDPDTVEGQLAMAVEDEESILGECAKVQVPTISLTWHYRSKDEALIAFSNHAYYKNRLATFPAPTAGGRHATGLRFISVPNGQFIRVNDGRLYRTNPAEATAIVAEITRRLHDPVESQWTMGVVTFNAQQQDLIERLLEESEDPLVQEAVQEPDPERRLFVKNLESVQGDERDIIMFSFAFSKNEKGVVPLTWGPMTRAGGERRLNVAVTRAKRQVLVFCSFQPHELNVEGSSSIAMRHVKEYLELAAFGTLPPAIGRSRGVEVRDYHREDIAAALRDRGLEVTENLGLSTFRIDLAVRVPGVAATPVLAVLLDGPRWRSRSTVGDRDALPLDVLAKAMNWPAVERVWLPTWLDDRDNVIDHLVTAAHQAAGKVAVEQREAPAEPAMPPAVEQAALVEEPESAVDEVADVVDWAQAAQPEVTRFEAKPETTVSEHTVTAPGDRDALLRQFIKDNGRRRPKAAPRPLLAAPAAAPRHAVSTGPTLAPYREWTTRPLKPVEEVSAAEVLRMLVEIVTAEGPMHAEWAYRRYVKASGKERLGSNVKVTFNRIMYEAVRSGRLRQIDDDVVGQIGRTVYAPGSEPVVLRELGPRALDDVPRSEIRAVAEAVGLGTESRVDVKRAVLVTYGRSVLTKVADKYLDEAFDYQLVTL